MTELRIFIPAAAIALAACGGGTAAPAAHEEETTTAGGEQQHADGGGHASARELIGIHPPEQPWSTMSHSDKEMDMIGRFLPITKEMFQHFDATRFADFGCETCHGSDMREREFAMPSPQLPPLPPPGTPAYRQIAEEHPEMMQFMAVDLTPTMQTMLGMGATFTCNGCHPTAANE